jgi:hypothetical protein
MQTFCALKQTCCRECADYHAPRRVYRAHFSVATVAKFLAGLWFLQDQRGIKETYPCVLLPGVLMGREAGRPDTLGQEAGRPDTLADTLQCKIWRRAQTPHGMNLCLHGGFDDSRNNLGITAPPGEVRLARAGRSSCISLRSRSSTSYQSPPSWGGCLSSLRGTTAPFLRR